MKKVKFIILVILMSKIAYSQKDIAYHYVLNEHIAALDSNPLFGMAQEFVTLRRYFSKSSFSETRLLTGSKTKSILYKIEKGVWYYRSRKKWNLFYDYDKMTGGYITLNKVKYKVQFRKVVSIRNEPLHNIVLEPIGMSQSHRPQYYFSPSKGIIIIKASSGIVLLRSDSFQTSLTDDESDFL